jgi:hypothetical protein
VKAAAASARPLRSPIAELELPELLDMLRKVEKRGANEMARRSGCPIEPFGCRGQTITGSGGRFNLAVNGSGAVRPGLILFEFG